MDRNPLNSGSKYAQFLEERGFLTINQLVQYLREEHPERSVSFPTIQRYIEKGYFRCTKVGGQYRIERPEIEHFIQHGTEGITVTPRMPVIAPPDLGPVGHLEFERAEGIVVRGSDPPKPRPAIQPPDVSKPKKGTSNAGS